MLTRLRRRLAHVGADRLTIVEANMNAPLPVNEPVDVVFSVAAMHLLPDHEAAFRSLAGTIRPEGVLRAEWGAEGNLANVEEALVSLGLPSMRHAFNFGTPEQTERRLRIAGFIDIDIAVVPHSARFESSTQLEVYLTTVPLRPVLDRLPIDQHDQVVRAVAARLPDRQVDFMRLQVSARRP
jgi:trans-aconitate 2-methyltransferase